MHCLGEPKQRCVCAFVRLEQLVVTVLGVFLVKMSELVPREKLLEITKRPGMDACHPVLAPPHEEHKKLHLGKCPRQCSTSKLAEILQESMRAHNFRL